MAKKRTRDASISVCVKSGKSGNSDVVERHGELGVGDEGRNLQRQKVQRVHAELAERQVHALAQLLRAVGLAAALVGVDLRGRREEREKKLWSSERRRCAEANPRLEGREAYREGGCSLRGF